ncbi:MAG: hypothetical protein KAJ95_04345 [Gammaproteobacteria bacterium]|nr:hypothetical protein [Gammaproteobacteria bacterium]
MSAALQTTVILLDIEPPMLPPESNISIIFAALTLLLILVIFIILSIRLYISPRSKARRHIKRLEKYFTNHIQERDSKKYAVDVRETSYQLAHIFAAGVELNGVTASTLLPVELNRHRERWQNYTRELSSTRYDKQYSRQVSLDKLFIDSLFFLKHWP